MQFQEGVDAFHQDRDPDTSDIEFDHPNGRRYTFGDWSYFEVDKETKEGIDTQTVPFARSVWPIEVYRHVDDDEHGIRFLYRSSVGDLRYGQLPSEATTGGSSARHVASDLASQGVQILTDAGKEFCFALGHWLEAVEDATVAYITSSPGWHQSGQVYVHGRDVIGDGTWYADTESPMIVKRSERSGSVERWTKWMDELATTPGLRAAIGASLAGSLIELCHPQNFVFHFHGDSSCGKSTAAEVACSVWGSPDGQYWQNWDTTVNAIEGNCEMADGACLVLDESTKWDSGEKALSKAIYNLASQTGRARMNTSGELRRQKSWKLTGLSTGEVSMSDQVGQWKKGGHDVRIHDVPVTKGDVTESENHADRLKQKVGANGIGGHYGVAGRLWSHYLVDQVTPFEAEGLRDECLDRLEPYYDGSKETGRILKNIALVEAAMRLGHRLDFDHAPNLVPWDGQASAEAAEWLAGKVVGQRRDKTPRERALRLLWDKIDTEPAHYPTRHSLVDGHVNAQVWGIKESYGDSQSPSLTGNVHLCESMLKASGLPEQSGVGPRSFLEWLRNEGYASHQGRQQIGGIEKSWCLLEDRPHDSSSGEGGHTS